MGRGGGAVIGASPTTPNPIEGRTSKELAAEVGEMLLAEKKRCGHGGFGKWCEENLTFNHVTRANYVKVAKIKITARCKFEAASSIREVLDIKDKPQAEPEPAPVERRAATLNDLRKVERLRALRDDPASTEGEIYPPPGKLHICSKINGLTWSSEAAYGSCTTPKHNLRTPPCPS